MDTSFDISWFLTYCQINYITAIKNNYIGSRKLIGRLAYKGGGGGVAAGPIDDIDMKQGSFTKTDSETLTKFHGGI